MADNADLYARQENRQHDQRKHRLVGYPAERQQEQAENRVDVQHVAVPHQQIVRDAEGEQDPETAQVHGRDVAAALRGPRHLNREPKPEQKGKDRIELPGEERVHDPFRALVPPRRERIESRRPRVPRGGGAGQVDRQDPEQREAAKHVEGDVALLR